MRLTLLILAINAEQELARILPELHQVGDELVIGIDDTTTDSTAEVARRFTDRIYPVPHAGFCGKGQPGDLNAVECMLPYCRGDWVLRVDQDETLSSLWHDQPYVAGLLDDKPATQYWIPRRLVVPPGDRYVCSGNLFPDYQLRLYRNIPSLIQFNRRPHDPPCIAGERRFLTEAWILHWDPVWYDRDRRQQKIAFYWDLGYTKDECGLTDFGDVRCPFRTRPLDHIYPSPSACLREAQLRESAFAAAFEVLDCPEVMQARTTEPILVAFKNCSSRSLFPSSDFMHPANVFVSYHWYSASHEIYHWDYARDSLPRPLPPGTWVSRFLNVAVPERPGKYFLQPDLVEENVAWFSQHCPIPTRAVQVI
jgi:hypothetical protein